MDPTQFNTSCPFKNPLPTRKPKLYSSLQGINNPNSGCLYGPLIVFYLPVSEVKDFVQSFNTSDPDWSTLPKSFPDCDLGGLSSSEVGKFISITTLYELSKPEKPKSRSRVWKDPEGYKYLVPWSNAVLLRFLIRVLTNSLTKSEYRRKSQLDDAGQSVVRNVEEGYKRATTGEYLNFVGYSQGSLEECKGDIVELADDGFLPSRPGSTLADIGIDLGKLHEALKESKGSYGKVLKGEQDSTYRPLKVLYPPLKNVHAEDLTVEIFIELINKTDYLFRKLVESLEKKMINDHKGYQIEQERIKGNIKWKKR